MQGYILKYNEDFIITKDETYRVVLKRFELKANVDKIDGEVKSKNMVRVKNLDFDIERGEIERVANDFGEVRSIEMKVK